MDLTKSQLKALDRAIALRDKKEKDAKAELAKDREARLDRSTKHFFETILGVEYKEG